MHRQNTFAPILGSILTLSLVASPPASAAVRAFVGARIIPIAGDEIPDGVLVIDDVKIVAVGPASSVAIPAGATRIDSTGHVIMPGLVDTHSHIGGVVAPTPPDRSSPACAFSIRSTCSIRASSARWPAD